MKDMHKTLIYGGNDCQLGILTKTVFCESWFPFLILFVFSDRTLI